MKCGLPRTAGRLALGAVIMTAFVAGCSSQPSTVLPAGTALPSSPIGASSGAAAAAPASANELKVMTFNLRVATAFDLWNTWDLRRGQVVQHIRKFNPDLLGTQEGLNSMESYLKKQLTDYTFFGVGRNDGNRRGEFAGIFYKTSKFTKLDGGNFWLSTDPHRPGSKAWGEWFPRMVTWVELQPRDGGRPFYWFNTHFAAFSGRARTESARLLLSRLAYLDPGSDCLVTGDFNDNAGAACQAYQTLTQSTGNDRLIDAFRAVHPVRTREEGTRHDFNGHRDGPRIDWILASPCFKPLSCHIDRGRGLLGYPSDHFPVTATFQMPATAGNPATPLARAQ